MDRRTEGSNQRQKLSDAVRVVYEKHGSHYHQHNATGIFISDQALTSEEQPEITAFKSMRTFANKHACIFNKLQGVFLGLLFGRRC